MLSIPLFYFPITIVCIDDDEFLLYTLKSRLEDGYRIKTITDPLEALQHIRNNPSILNTNFLNDITTSHDYDGLDVTHSSVVEFDLSVIMEMVNSPDRFNEIGVIIVDYKMPRLNGIELCKELIDIKSKKILLTGEANDKEAITAFNDELINCYVKKGEESTISKLVSYTNKFMQQYFIELTAPLRIHLENIGLNILSDQKFINFFNGLIEKNFIKEYYLIDKNGSFLLINNKKQKFILAIHTDNSLNDLINLFKHESKISLLVDAMKQRQRIPFFGLRKNPAHIPFEEWLNFFCKAERLECQQNYYWSLISLKGESDEN